MTEPGFDALPQWAQVVLTSFSGLAVFVAGLLGYFRRSPVLPAKEGEAHITAASLFASQPIYDLTSAIRNLDGTMRRVADHFEAADREEQTRDDLRRVLGDELKKMGIKP